MGVGGAFVRSEQPANQRPRIHLQSLGNQKVESECDSINI